MPATPDRLASLRRQVAPIDADLGGTMLPEALHQLVNRGAAAASPARSHQSFGWNPAAPVRQSTNAYSSARSSSTCERVEPTP